MQSSFLPSLLETIVGLLLARLDNLLEILLPDSLIFDNKSKRFKTKKTRIQNQTEK